MQKGEKIMRTTYKSVKDLIVAVDIGKNVHCLGCYDGQLHELVAPYDVRSDLTGFAQFHTMLDALIMRGHFHHIIIGNEPTGVYHEPWAWQIYRTYLTPAQPLPCPVHYHWLNPLLSNRRRQQRSIRQRSTDAIAVVAIAACLADGLGYPAYFPTPAEAQLRERVQQHTQGRQQLQHQAQQILAQVDRLWPGALVDVKKFRRAHPDLDLPQPIVRSKPLERARLAAFLTYAPNPYTVRAWSQEQLIAFLRQHVGRGGPKTAQTIQAILRHAPLPPPAIAELYAQRLQADFRAYQALLDRMEALKTTIAEVVPLTEARFLVSVPGISPLLAARYTTALGSVQRFPSAGHIWSFAGLDLVVDDSGDRRRKGKLTKRGDPALRNTLYLIGQHTARSCPPIGNAFLNARARGKSEIEATIHAAHKANRLCFALLREQRLYRPVSPAAQLAFQRRYHAYHNAHTPKKRRRRRSAAQSA
jgi:transposase